MARVDGTVSVTVGIKNNPGLVSARLIIEYDEEYLKLRDAVGDEEYTITNGFGSVDYYYSSNQLVVLMIRSNDGVDWNGDTFITLVFNAKKAGNTSINVSSNDVGNSIPAPIHDSIAPVFHSFNITSVKLGDLNNDGILSSLDIVLLRRAVAAGATVFDHPAGDINNDGILSSLDIILLRRAVAAGAIEILPGGTFITP
jgi:hypothetical protein